MINARPITGFGWGKFQDDSLLYFKQSQNYPLTDENKFGLHNFLLSYAVELGLPGLTLWALGLILGVGSALLSRGPPDLGPWRVALLAIFVMLLVVSNSVPPTEFPNLSVWLFAGVAFSGRYAVKARAGPAPAVAPAPAGTAPARPGPALA
jgi:O-antigen ligase